MGRTYGKKMVEKYAVVSTDCDHCGRSENGEPDGWVGIDFGHDDWGNDSIESNEHWDACSAPCLIALLARIAVEYEIEWKDPTLWVSLKSDGRGAWASDGTIECEPETRDRRLVSKWTRTPTEEENPKTRLASYDGRTTGRGG